MTTLTAPQKASITITTPGQSVPVTCATGDKMQVDWVSPGGVTGSRLVMNETVDIGPLADNTVVTFSALAGSPTYSAGKVVTAEYNNLTGGSDLSTDLATLKLPAGVTDLTSGVGVLKTGLPLLVIGDSITVPTVGKPPITTPGGQWSYNGLAGTEIGTQVWVDNLTTTQGGGSLQHSATGQLRWQVTGDTSYGPWVNATAQCGGVGGWVRLTSGDGVSQCVVSVAGANLAANAVTATIAPLGALQSWAYEPKFWPNWVMGRMGKTFSDIKCFSIAGAQTDDMLLWTPQALSYGPYGAAIFAGGINDAGAEWSLPTSIAIINLLAASVPIVYVMRRLPNLNPAWTTPLHDLTARIDIALREYCATKSNVRYIDCYLDLMDAYSATEVFAGPLIDFHVDALHPRCMGAAKIGYDLVAPKIMQDFKQTVPVFKVRTGQWDAGQKKGILNLNPTLRGSAGTITAANGITSAIGAPDGWTVKRVGGGTQLCNCDWVDAVDGGAPFYTMIPSNGDGVGLHQIGINTTVPAGVVKGDILRMTIEVQIGATTGYGLKSLAAVMNTVGGTNAVLMYPLKNVASNNAPYEQDVAISSGRRILLLHALVKFDTGAVLATRLDMALQLQVRDASSTGEVGVRFMALEVNPTA